MTRKKAWPPTPPPRPEMVPASMRVTRREPDAPWRERAACRGFPVDLWFPERGEDQTIARQICAECGCRVECLIVGLADTLVGGIWGGLCERDRRRLRRLLRDHLPRLAQHLPDDPEPPHPAIHERHLTRAARRAILAAELAGRDVQRGEAVRLARRFGCSEATISLDLSWVRQRAAQLPEPEPGPMARDERRRALVEELAEDGHQPGDHLPWSEIQEYAARFGVDPQTVYKDMRWLRERDGDEEREAG